MSNWHRFLFNKIPNANFCHFLNIVFKCGKCDESFETGRLLGYHLRAHARLSIPIRTSNSAAASAPLKKAVASAPVKVKEIKSKVSKPPPKVAQKPMSKRGEYQCYLCKIKYKSLVFMRKHMKLHSDRIKSVAYDPCSICRIKIRRKEMNAHLCDQKDSVQCEYCSVHFMATNELLDHLETMHPINRRLYRCEKCIKYFPMIFLRDSHQTCHANEPQANSKTSGHRKVLNVEKSRANLCDECGKTFCSGALKQRVEIDLMMMIFTLILF